MVMDDFVEDDYNNEINLVLVTDGFREDRDTCTTQFASVCLAGL